MLSLEVVKKPSLCLSCCLLGFIALPAQQLDLIDAEDASFIQSLSGNTSLELNSLGKRALNIRYTPADAGTASVAFYINGGLSRIDSVSPYNLAGWAEGIEGALLPQPGSYSIEFREYSAVDGNGSLLTTTTLALSVTDALSHRMRSVRLVTGQPYTRVRLRMLKHAFPFGSMTNEPLNPAEAQISLRETSDEQNQQDIFHANFNYSVSGNQMKWYVQQPDWWSGSPHQSGYATPGLHQYGTTDNWTGYMAAQNVPVRGHAVFWGEKADSEQTPTDLMHDPDWVEALGTEALYWMEQRAKSIVGRYAGKVDDWDFVNELWHGDWYRDTFGTSITKQMADWVLEANPNARLWYNEYNMLDSTSNSEQFRTLLEQLILEGVPVDGIGCQAHFGSAPDAATVKAALDILDDLGRPIMLTEFDCGWGADNTDAARELEEADGLEAVYRTAFEHEAVAGIIMWGFWEGNHWQPQRALWLNDWTPTPKALRYQSLVLDEWWTDAQLVTDASGNLQFAAFAGEYEIDIAGDLETISLSAGEGMVNWTYENNSLSSSSALEIQLKRPVDKNRYAKCEAVEFLAEVNAGAHAISKVEFYVGGVLIKRDSTAPYTAVWLESTGGVCDVWAVVTDANNATATSSTHSISVIWDNQDNLLSNPGFESGTTGWSVFGDGNFSMVNDPSYDGAQALLMSGRTATWNGIGRDVSNLLTAGKNYAYSCYARLGAGVDNCKLVLRIAYTDGSDPEYINIVEQSVGADAWTAIQGDFIYLPDAGKTVSNATLYLSGPAAGTDLYGDAFLLQQGEGNPHDSDLDGLWDTWETSYFGGTNADHSGADDDYDQDGIRNFWEFHAGTDPTDAASGLRITAFEKLANSVRIDWRSESERSYRILRADDLISGNWVPLMEQITAAPGENSQTLSESGAAGYYKVTLDE